MQASEQNNPPLPRRSNRPHRLNINGREALTLIEAESERIRINGADGLVVENI